MRTPMGLHYQRGYALPLVIGVSFMMTVLSLQVLGPLSATKNQLQTVAYARIAQRASEAGALYARYCLEQSGGTAQWTDGSPLKPSTDCAGNARAGTNCSSGTPALACYVAKASSHASWFSVPAPTGTGATKRISPTGTVTASKTDGSIYRTVNQSAAAMQVSGGAPSSLAVSQLAIWNTHVCATSTLGAAHCWGANNYGQLGNGGTANSSVPVAVTTSGLLAGKTVTSISVGPLMTCVIASDDRPYCWGRNNYGQLGNGGTANSSVPVAVTTSGVLNGKTVKVLETANNPNVSPASTSCVIASDNLAYCWGISAHGQLGNGSGGSSTVPVAVTTSGVLNGKTIKTLKAGFGHICVIASDDLAYCWGKNNVGQLGNGSTANSSVPVAVTTAGVLNGKTIKAIEPGNERTCVIASDDRPYCWGNGSSGALGNGSQSNSSVPVAVNVTGALSGKTVKSLVSYERNTCVIASDDRPYCWGSGSSGALGNGSQSNSSVPVAVTTTGVLNGKTVKALRVGYQYACVIASDDRPYCWGANNYGQLGNGGTANSSVPVAVTTSGVLNGKAIKGLHVTAASQSIGGPRMVCATDASDLLYCWGQNSSSQFGDGTTTNSSVPVASVLLPGSGSSTSAIRY